MPSIPAVQERVATWPSLAEPVPVERLGFAWQVVTELVVVRLVRSLVPVHARLREPNVVMRAVRTASGLAFGPPPVAPVAVAVESAAVLDATLGDAAGRNSSIGCATSS